MSRSLRRPARYAATVATGALAVSAALGATVAGPALAGPNASTGALSPGSVATASNATYAYTLTNTTTASSPTGILTLSSALVDVPAGYGTPTGFTSTNPTWSATVTTDPNTGGPALCLSGSGLAPGGTVTIGFTDVAPASPAVTTWSTLASTFSGCQLLFLGNFPFNGSQPQVAVDKLVYFAHSTSGVVSKPITPGFTVEAQDASGTRDSAFTRPITLKLGQNPGGATPFTTTVNASSGDATFTPTIDKIGSGYTVLASSDSSPGVSSEPIYITSAAKSVACNPGASCDTGVVAPTGHTTTAAEAIGAAGPASDVVSIAVGDKPAISCGTNSGTAPPALDVFVGDFNRHLTVKALYDRDTDGDPFSGFTKALSPSAFRGVCFQGSNDPAPHTIGACTGTDANGFGTPEPCIQSEFVEPDDSSAHADLMSVLSLNPDPDPHIVNIPTP
jgi:hypothetical protein